MWDYCENGLSILVSPRRQRLMFSTKKKRNKQLFEGNEQEGYSTKSEYPLYLLFTYPKSRYSRIKNYSKASIIPWIIKLSKKYSPFLVIESILVVLS
jgi:hypothetical protein